METKSRIFCSAIKYNKIVIVGKRHNDCIASLSKITNKNCDDCEQGFIDEDGIFLTREQARERAIECDQVNPHKTWSMTKLFSEDLY